MKDVIKRIAVITLKNKDVITVTKTKVVDLQQNIKVSDNKRKKNRRLLELQAVENKIAAYCDKSKQQIDYLNYIDNIANKRIERRKARQEKRRARAEAQKQRKLTYLAAQSK